MGQLATEVRTPRLRLRPPRSEDAAFIATLINDFDFVRMLSRVPFPYALSDAEWFVRMVKAKDPNREQTFAIEHPDFGLIGVIGFHEEEGAPLRLPEIGYWLGRTFWGRGFATDASAGAPLAGFLYTGEVRRQFSLARQAEAETRMMVWLA